MRVFRLSAALAVAATLGCGVTALEDSELVLTTVVVEPNMIGPGETTQVVVRLSNPTTRALTLSGNQCILSWRVLDSEGLEVFPVMQPCADILRVITIGPGESVSMVFPFYGVRMTPNADGDFFQTPLEPGTYWIEAGLTTLFLSPSERVPLTVR